MVSKTEVSSMLKVFSDHQIKKLKNEPPFIADFNLVLSQHELLLSNSILAILTNFQSMFDKNEYLKYLSL